MPSPILKKLSAAIRGSFHVQPPMIPSPTDYVAYWTMDDAQVSGATLLDVSGNSHTATMVNAPTTGVDGQKAEAVLFNGTDEYATVVDHADLKPTNVTVSGWVLSNSVSGLGQSLVSNRGFDTIDDYGYWCGLDSSGFPFVSIADGLGTTTQLLGTEPILDGKLHHLACTYDDAVLRIYVDGSLAGFVPVVGGMAYWATQFFEIGSNFPGTVRSIFYEGPLDDIKIFTRAISAAEVRAMFIADGGFVPAPQDYIARWTMDDITGATLFDATYRDHDGTITGALPITGVIGNALSFDGIDDKVDLVNHADLRPLTYSAAAWINLTTVTANNSILSIWRNVTAIASGFDFRVNSTGKAFINVASNTGGITGTDFQALESVSDVDDGTWRHVIATWDDKNLRIYVDGVFEGAVAYVNSVGYHAGLELRIGSRSSDEGVTEEQLLGGLLDDVRLYGRAITPAEVRAIYDARVPAPPSDFVAEWTMDDVAGAVLNESLNSHDATLVNSPTFAPGYEGDAMTLDGVTQYATIVQNAELKPASLTVAGRIRTTSVLGSIILNNFDAVANLFSGYYLTLSAAGQVMLFACKNTGSVLGTDYQRAPSATLVNDGVWHHVACSFNGLELKTYVDGVLETVVLWAEAIVYNGTEDPHIGVREFVATRDTYYDGELDKLQLFNRAVSPQEVAAMAGVVYTPPPTVNIDLTPAAILDSVPNGPYTTATVVSGVTGGVGPFTYSWARISGSTITADTPLAADTSFSGNRTDAESLETFELTVTDQGDFDSTHTKQIAVNIIWGSPP